MKPIIDQLLALLAQAGMVAHYVAVPDAERPVYPYLLLWGSPGQSGIESSVTADADLSDLLGVTAADTTPGNVLLLVDRARAVLDGVRFTVAGMDVTLSRSVGQDVREDTDFTVPDTNRHPCFAVDRYQLVATPA